MTTSQPPGFLKGTINLTKQSPPSPTTYLLSDDPTLLDLPALSAAFASPLTWWCSPVSSPEALQALVSNSYCFGLYTTTATSPKQMIGFARLITDYVTFAYLTDVYVLEEHQGLGLGTFMMEGVRAALEGWPDLRRGLLMTHEPGPAKVYRKVFGAVDVREKSVGRGEGEPELIAMEWKNR